MELSEGTSPSIEPTSLALGESQISPDFMQRPSLDMCSPTLTVQGHELSPLPVLDWDDSSKMWEEMRSKDTYQECPEAELHFRHPCILPVMRTRLVSWIMHACFYLHFHRETFYLFLVIFDRYMDTQCGVQPEQPS